MTTRQWLVLFGIALLAAAILMFAMQGVGFKNIESNNYGSWVCQDGSWVKIGQTNQPRPVTICK